VVKRRELPSTNCFSDAVHTMQYDPMQARLVFFICFNILASLVGAAHMVTACLSDRNSAFREDHHSCGRSLKHFIHTLGYRLSLAIYAFLAAALLVGGAIVGNRYDRSIPGACNAFRHKVWQGGDVNSAAHGNSYWVSYCHNFLSRY
jgi:hypothetical protein